jgi:hypothetical protein
LIAGRLSASKIFNHRTTLSLGLRPLFLTRA